MPQTNYRDIRWVILNLLISQLLALDVPAVAQVPAYDVRIVSSSAGRLMFPAGQEVDGRTRELLFRALTTQTPPEGLPDPFAWSSPVTISLAQALPAEFEATFDAVQRLIILPLHDVSQWDLNRMNWAVRHEWAHIALATYVQFAPLPLWVSEGYAEWVSGGVTCEGHTRIALELALRRASNRPLPNPARPVDLGRTRVAYDLFTSLFDFLEREYSVVSSGRFLRDLRQGGAEHALIQATQMSVEASVAAWQQDVLARFSQIPRCDPKS